MGYWVNEVSGPSEVYQGFCYVVLNSHMFNATEVQLCKWCFHIKFLLLVEANTRVAL
jgi:hypothetical protein